MVLSKQAVTEFRARSQRDCNWVKQLSESELDRQLTERGAVWHTNPRDYQKACLLLGLKLKSLYLLVDPGLGKTKVILDTFRTRLRTGKVKRLLVLVPALANVEGWREQVEEHTPMLRFAGIDEGDRFQKLEAVEDPHNQVVCVTYMGWLALTHQRVKAKGRKKRPGLKRDDREHDRLASLFDMVAWDEINALASHDSLSFRSARRFTRLVPYRYGLSGTPMDKDPTALWAQFYALDAGETLGATLGLFRGSFFTEVEDYWAGTTWTFDKRNKKDLRRRLRNRAIRYRDYECLDLPPVVGGLLGGKFMVRSATWPSSTWHFYERLLDELAEARGNREQLENTYLRMRQATAGFLPMPDEHGRKHIIKFDENPLLDLLVTLLRELPEERKVLIYTEFVPSGDLVAKRLSKEKIPALRLFGGTGDKKGTLRRFKQDPQVRCLIGSRAVVYGLNLQVANYGILYDSPDSTIAREQFERRLYRQGQTRHTYFYDLVVRNSVGARILKALREGRNLREELLESDNPRDLVE